MEHNSFDALKQRMEQMQNSPEYQANCQRLSQVCTRLETVARELYARREALQAHCLANAVRTEYAADSDLHRGYYCPSPTYDFIVGNTHRGKLLKKRTPFSKPSHEYGFDTNDRLLYCKWLRKGTVIMAEYLDRTEHTVHGILLNNQGWVSAITEEIYADGHLTEYLYGLCIPSGDGFQCRELNREAYEYDEIGLCGCHMETLLLPMQDIPDSLKGMIQPFMRQPVYRGDAYRFDRKDGFLIGYRNEKGQHYRGTHVRRKA